MFTSNIVCSAKQAVKKGRSMCPTRKAKFEVGKLFLTSSRQILLACDGTSLVTVVIFYYVKWHLINSSLRYIVDHSFLHPPRYQFESKLKRAMLFLGIYLLHMPYISGPLPPCSSKYYDRIRFTAFPSSKETGTPTPNLIEGA